MIAEYTRNRWGEDQMIRYLDGLEVCCQQLVVSPLLGRSCNEIRAELRRIEHGSHVIFYRSVAEGILIVRILHRSMLPGRQLIEEIDP